MGRGPASRHAARTSRTSESAGRELYAAIQRDPLWLEWQEGRLTPAEWHRNVCRRFGAKATFEQFSQAWNSIIVPEPHLMLPIALFRQLHQRYRLVLLSNTDPLHVAHMEHNFAFRRHFDAAIYSCAVGASKPSREIFRAAIRAAAAPPARILFVDDVREYTVAARRLGMQAVHFRNRAQFLNEIRNRTSI
jgi:HAD superfamily hydrolase (TIGR01509 family)